jgi:hypothetical protein
VFEAGAFNRAQPTFHIGSGCRICTYEPEGDSDWLLSKQLV